MIKPILLILLMGSTYTKYGHYYISNNCLEIMPPIHTVYSSIFGQPKQMNAVDIFRMLESENIPLGNFEKYRNFIQQQTTQQNIFQHEIVRDSSYLKREYNLE
jgi:hypothetical protein